MTAVSVVKPSRRGTLSRKRPLWLPIIAPKDDAIPPAVTASLSSGPVKNPIPKTRIRFPPRSRTGCCRKVKCDESHPQCNQCTRLGHVCDYKPRLCFRDDTRRVMDRMSYVKVAGNAVWDPNVISRRSLSDDHVPHDLLPSFAVLASDEERERKALASIPGTYHVVVIPESFAHLPEYTSPVDRELDLISSPISGDSDSDHLDSHLEVDDPNVVIVKIVRDTRRYPYTHRGDSTQSPDSDIALPLPAESALYPAIQSMVDEDPAQDKFDLRNYEIALLLHFRNAVWPQLMAGAIFANSNHHHLDFDILEQEAMCFPPLFNAMMAVSALSRFRQGDDQSVHSQHYINQAYDFLQTQFDSGNDTLSDRIFFTYFLLLIYEAIAPRTSASTVWSHHAARLMQIYLARQTTLGGERYPFIIWWVCNIDLYALLSGVGTGEFVRPLLDHQLYPGLDFLLYPMEPGHSNYATDQDNLSTLLRLYHDMFTLLARMGLFAASARDFRQTYPDSPLDHQLNAAEGLREEFRQLWGSSEMCFLWEIRETLPELSQYILQQVTLLFHTALLFSYTSLWPRQRLEVGNGSEEEIHHHATMILQLADTMVSRDGECGRQLVAFPMFLAGAVAASSGLKIRAWQLLSSLEEEEMGYNASTTNYLLQLVYERQMQHSRDGSEAFWIDWMELVTGRERPTAHYG
ncbi:putative Zn(II)2Cys6 transcription factor [Aspergillus ambiguus]|uniref:uncharacterized protein n=1 Tax=Aspergillus ambiguus TaxID=176160 RepID=UPI003CCDBC18